MRAVNLSETLLSMSYPGRGIVIGRSKDGGKAIIAYFIMGRSENSRNRIFVEQEEGIRTEAYDPSKMVDPSLIIYAPVRVWGKDVVVTNGDQTDTVVEGLKQGLTFEQSLRSRCFEPDGPNYTPRISGILHLEGDFWYEMSILKSHDGDPGGSARYTFSYENPLCGEGRFIHTYERNEEPLPSFEGEPTRVDGLEGSIDELGERIWSSLNEDNKVSLFVRLIDLSDGSYETRIYNKHGGRAE